jgi:5'-nucleotidase
MTLYITEGYLFGIPAIAFSQVDHRWAHLDAAARVAKDIVLRKFEALHKPFLLNVNIPNLPYEKLQRVVATRLGKRHESEPVIKTQDPHGNDIFWIGPVGKAKEASAATN